MIGSGEGGREGGDEGRATWEEASEDMTRGTHLTAVYPALFNDGLVTPWDGGILVERILLTQFPSIFFCKI